MKPRELSCLAASSQANFVADKIALLCVKLFFQLTLKRLHLLLHGFVLLLYLLLNRLALKAHIISLLTSNWLDLFFSVCKQFFDEVDGVKSSTPPVVWLAVNALIILVFQRHNDIQENLWVITSFFIAIHGFHVSQKHKFFLRENVGRCSITFSNVSDMIAISMFKKVIWEMTTVMRKSA